MQAQTDPDQDAVGTRDAARFGRALRMIRAQRGLSLMELAEMSGVTHGTLSKIERGVQATTSLPVAVRIANALEVPLDAMLRPGGPAW